MSDIKALDEATEKHIEEDIDWNAFQNEVIKTALKSTVAKGDVE